MSKFEQKVILPLCSLFPRFFRLFYPNRKWGINMVEDIDVLTSMSPKEFKRRMYMLPEHQRNEWIRIRDMYSSLRADGKSEEESTSAVLKR